jgi:hypothetical protein
MPSHPYLFRPKFSDFSDKPQQRVSHQACDSCQQLFGVSIPSNTSEKPDFSQLGKDFCSQSKVEVGFKPSVPSPRLINTQPPWYSCPRTPLFSCHPSECQLCSRQRSKGFIGTTLLTVPNRMS